MAFYIYELLINIEFITFEFFSWSCEIKDIHTLSANRGIICIRFVETGKKANLTTYAINAYHHKHCEFESCSGEVYSI
jgi:pyruvate carboxylase